MLIRDARESDARAIGRFIAMAESEMVHFFTGTDDIDDAVPVMESFVRSPVENRYSLRNNLVAEVDGETAGAIIAFPADRQPDLDSVMLDALRARGLDLDSLCFEGEPGTYYLSTMGVDPAARGRGVGTALMTAAMARGKQLGYRHASLLVSAQKPRARALYERVGFAYLRDVAMGGVVYQRMQKAL